MGENIYDCIPTTNIKQNCEVYNNANDTCKSCSDNAKYYLVSDTLN